MFFSTSQIDQLSAGKEPEAHGMGMLSRLPLVCVSGGGRREQRFLLPTELQDVLLPSGAYWIMTKNRMYSKEKGAPLH